MSEVILDQVSNEEYEEFISEVQTLEPYCKSLEGAALVLPDQSLGNGRVGSVKIHNRLIEDDTVIPPSYYVQIDETSELNGSLVLISRDYGVGETDEDSQTTYETDFEEHHFIINEHGELVQQKSRLRELEIENFHLISLGRLEEAAKLKPEIEELMKARSDMREIFGDDSREKHLGAMAVLKEIKATVTS